MKKLVLLVLICFVTNCHTVTNNRIRPEQLDVVKNDESVVFGYIDPSVIFQVYDNNTDSYFAQAVRPTRGLLWRGLLGAPSLTLTFKNVDTGKLYSAKVSVHRFEKREFLVVLPKGSYSLNVSSPIIYPVAADSLFTVSGGGNAIYIGDLELKTNPITIGYFKRIKKEVKKFNNVFLTCIQRFEERKKQFLKKYPKFKEKILLGNDIGAPIIYMVP